MLTVNEKTSGTPVSLPNHEPEGGYLSALNEMEWKVSFTAKLFLLGMNYYRGRYAEHVSIKTPEEFGVEKDVCYEEIMERFRFYKDEESFGSCSHQAVPEFALLYGDQIRRNSRLYIVAPKFLGMGFVTRYIPFLENREGGFHFDLEPLSEADTFTPETLFLVASVPLPPARLVFIDPSSVA